MELSNQELADKLKSMQRVTLERELAVQEQLDALNERVAQLEKERA